MDPRPRSLFQTRLYLPLPWGRSPTMTGKVDDVDLSSLIVSARLKPITIYSFQLSRK